MKIISWNVTSLRAILQKGFKDSVLPIAADVICLQETKVNPDTASILFDEYEHKYWNCSIKKGYSGTAIFSKIKPLAVSYGIGIKDHDMEGRVITAEFDDFQLVCVYVPNSGAGLKRLDYRMTWNDALLAYLTKIEKKKPVVVAGDLNVAHTPMDIKNAKSNYNKSAGYTQKEIDGFSRWLSAGFVDTFRALHPDEVKYSYWSQRFTTARLNNVGWRLDYVVVSKSLLPRVKDAFILNEIMGSDHCPVGITLR